MARKVRTTFLYVVASVLICASLYHHHLRNAISTFSSDHLRPSPAIISASSSGNYAIHENLTDATVPPHDTTSVLLLSLSPSPPPPPPAISTTAVLLPEWEVLVIVSPETAPSNLDGNYSCLYDTNEATPAKFAGVLPFPDRATFSCLLPPRSRRRLPFKQPVLSESPPENHHPSRDSPSPPLIRWSHMVYDSLTTEDDVVLFVKGVNARQGINREPREFRCVFGEDAINGVKTAVTSSMQEVFRCKRPPLTPSPSRPAKVSLLIVAENQVVPSVAYYTPPRTLAPSPHTSLLCATTMVYDITKFLKEWVVYHSRIGVEKFLLYDNGSDDNLDSTVADLIKLGYDVSTYFWRWPKTQEAGFSHSALYAKHSCKWMMYLDVDEFVYSPSWQNHSTPSKTLLHPFIHLTNSSRLGQISINCHEFGPSDQTVHPKMGVLQGYNCRRRFENRHKSIVLLDAIDHSLLNVIHHFYLRQGYKARKLGTNNIVVNHYKYQAWPEFKAKFRRRVSAYVLDWTEKLNPRSNDRTPGLGFAPVEPTGWAQKFCEVRDNKLRDLTLRWFGVESDSGFRMAWQR
ncbi:hypothetical protein ABFX02_03G007900 [Erythranthe guttata]